MVREKTAGDQAAWAARQGALTPLDVWQLDGRVAINAGRDAYSGTLAWQQDGAALDFQFKGPFGLGGLRIWGGADALTVKTHKGETFTITDPERDLGERLGWSLPIRSMRFWMEGVPAPDAAFAAEVDGLGRPLKLEQQGWTVTYAEFQQVGAYDLPKRLEIERGAVRIKVVAERWSIKAVAPTAASGPTTARAEARADDVDDSLDL